MKKYLLRRLGVAKDLAGDKLSLSTCLEMVLEQTPTLLDDLYSGVQTQVNHLQSAKQAAADRSLYFSAATTVEVDVLLRFLEQRPVFRACFQMHLQEQVRHGGAKKSTPTAAVRFDDFMLLEDDQIDANIEQALTEQTVCQCVQERVGMVHSLMSSLMGWVTVQGQFNPLRPENYAYALRLALSDSMTEKDAHNSGLQVMLATLLGTSLSQLYAELITWLKSMGVELLQPVHAFGNSEMPPTKVQRTLLTMDKLRRLLTQEIHLWPVQQDFTHTVPSSIEALEDLKLVDAMMQRLSERAQQSGRYPSPESLEEAEERHNQMLGRQLGKQLGQEVVHLMLDHLAQDGRIPLQVRLSLADLEDVLNALSDQDPRFFSDRKHPARLFLERITHRSLGFRNNHDLGYVAFQSMLDSTVKSLRQGSADAAAFAHHLQLLEERWSAEEASMRARAEAQAKDLVLQEQRNLLASKWSQAHADLIGTRPVPDFVQQFLRGPWAHVVALAEMRGSDAIAELESYQELVRKLIWSTQLAKVQKHPGRLMRMVPRMLMTLRQGLQTIAYPDEQSKEFLDAMIAVHEQAFDAARSNFEPLPTLTAVVQAVAVAPEPDTEPDVVELPEDLLAPADAEDVWRSSVSAPLDGEVEADQSVYVPPVDVQVPPKPDPALQAAWSADQLMPGAWVDLAWKGQWVRAQLNWASPHRTLFMFVSAGGFSHTMSRRTMSRLRGLGLLRLISDGHVMDNALDAVAKVALQNDIQAHREKH